MPGGSAIYGGEPADEGEYPWMVELHWEDGTHICGGALLTPTIVLTAAHCTPSEADAALASQGLSVPTVVWGSYWDTTVAVIGSTDRFDPDGEVRAIRAFQRHPLYHVPAYFNNDIAIVELTEPSTKPTLAFAGPEDVQLYAEGGVDARVIGWGCTETTCEQQHLLETNVTVLDDGTCKTSVNELARYDPATMVCASSSLGHDACGGDSGGPLFVEKDGRWLVIGVVSYGPIFVPNTEDPMGSIQPCGTEEPGVFTEVAAFTDFLTS